MKLQFRLRTLMIVVALVAAMCGAANWYRGEAEFVRERFILSGESPARGAHIAHPPRELPWIRRWLGDNDYIEIYLELSASDEDVQRYKVMFPEATITRL
jgi:hypothetical protein